MQFVIDANRVKEFREKVNQTFPEWKAQGQVQIVNVGGYVGLSGIRGYKLTLKQIATIMEIIEEFTSNPEAAAPSVPAWQPVRRHTPRYSSQTKAAGKLRLR